MSNPLAIFRKNQKLWMAGLVLLALLAFVVVPSIQQYAGSGQANLANAQVVSWEGGSLTVGDLDFGMQQHGRLERFLNAVAKEVMQNGGRPQVPGFQFDPQQGAINLGIMPVQSADDLCRVRILATKAKNLGIVFSDQSADEFLLAFCDNRLETSRIEEILFESSGGLLQSYDVRELIKHDLAAATVFNLGRTGLATLPPGELWDNFLKLNRQARVRAFPVFTADFLKDVKGQPTDAQVQDIYNDGISRFPDPAAPEPGFQRPARVSLEYAEFSQATFLEREKAKLTDNQLHAEYERMVGLGQLQTPVEPGPGGNVDGSLLESGALELPGSPELSNQNTDLNGDTAQNPEGTAASDTNSATPEPSEPSNESTNNNESGDGASTEAPAEASPAPDNQSSQVNQDRVQYVSLIQDTDSTSEAAQSNPPSDSTPESSSEAIAEANANDPPPVVQPPQLGEESSTETTLTENQPIMRTLSFEEARGQVADSLARPLATAAMDKSIADLKKTMQVYYEKHRRFVASKENKLPTESEEPIAPDLKKLSTEFGFTYGVTGLIDIANLAQTELGSSIIIEAESMTMESVYQRVMTSVSPLYQPIESFFFDRQAFMRGEMSETKKHLCWKVEFKAAYVPELAEVRDEIIDYWKRQEARQAAEKAANELAKKVTGDEPWKNALSTAEQSLVVETAPFTWMSRFSEEDFFVSNIPELDTCGEQFMQRVFTAPLNQAVVAPNNPRTAYYVFQVAERSPSIEELETRFTADTNKFGPISMAAGNRRAAISAWLSHVYQELNVQFTTVANDL